MATELDPDPTSPTAASSNDHGHSWRIHQQPRIVPLSLFSNDLVVFLPDLCAQQNTVQAAKQIPFLVLELAGLERVIPHY